MHIRTSERRDFKRCPQRWWWSWVDGLYRKGNTVNALWFGTGVHEALAAWYGKPGTARGPLPADTWAAWCGEEYRIMRVDNDFEETEYVEARTLGAEMLRGYVETYGKDEWMHMIAVETPFQIMVRRPDGTSFEYDGTFDGVFRDLRNDELFVLEHKTAKQIMLRHLSLDDQAGCVPLDTEILTSVGWKRPHELVVGERVLGYDIEADSLRWTTLEDVGVFRDQPTVEYTGYSFSFVATPSHKWVVDSYFQGKPSAKRLEPLPVGTQHRRVMLASELDEPTIDITEDEAALIAWILTDGCIGSYKRGGLAVTIVQKNYPDVVDALVQRLDCSTGRKSLRDGCWHWRIRTPYARELFRRAGLSTTRELEGWEGFVLGLSAKARRAFCEAGMLAEGSKERPRFHQYRKTGPKQDMFRLAFSLAGNFCGKGGDKQFSVLAPYRWASVIQARPGLRQDVWCPQTALGTWVMRQGNQIAVTGNSYIWTATEVLRARGVLKPTEKLSGVLYNILRKQLPDNRPRNAQGHYTNQPKKENYWQAFEQAAQRGVQLPVIGKATKLETLQEIAQQHNLVVLGDVSKQQPMPNFEREFVWRNDKERLVMAQRVISEEQHMAAFRSGQLPLYKTPTRDCSWDCSFFEMCELHEMAGDWEEFRDTYYGRRNPYAAHTSKSAGEPL